MANKKQIANEHLIYILENTTPYQRMVWLKRAFEFWRHLQKRESWRKVVKRR